MSGSILPTLLAVVLFGTLGAALLFEMRRGSRIWARWLRAAGRRARTLPR